VLSSMPDLNCRLRTTAWSVSRACSVETAHPGIKAHCRIEGFLWLAMRDVHRVASSGATQPTQPSHLYSPTPPLGLLDPETEHESVQVAHPSPLLAVSEPRDRLGHLERA